MDWQNYISYLLADESSIDGITLSFGNYSETVKVPPIIKASILMLDKMLEHQGKFNIFVFPERAQSIFTFTLTKLLYNIAEGRIDSVYNPEEFLPGDRLRLGKAVVEFVRMEDYEGKRYMCIKLADVNYKAPMEYIPLFQKTTAKRLSKCEVFDKEKIVAKEKLKVLSDVEAYVKLLTDYKTHMDSSIVYMTSIINTKELMAKCNLCGQSLKEAILVGQADYEGNVKNIGAGQLSGIPAIVLASDLYSIVAMVHQGHPIQSIIIDASNSNSINSQLDALDDLLKKGMPITCVTDVVNSFDLQLIQERGFNVWRWDETSITNSLYDVSSLSSDKKIKNCAMRTIDYLITNDAVISKALSLLCSHQKASQMESANLMKVFEKLFSLAFRVLRETVSIEAENLIVVNDSLEQCKSVLEAEKRYVSIETFNKYNEIISCLQKVYDKSFILQKHDMLAKFLGTCNNRTVAIVIPEGANKDRVQIYWQNWCDWNNLCIEIKVFYPAEYYLLPCNYYEVTVVVGWLKRAIMRKILYSFNTHSYVVLLYDYEKHWKSYTIFKWSAALDVSQNRKVIEKSFNTKAIKIATKRFSLVNTIEEETPSSDEFADIEITLRENKYRQYIANGGQKTACETTEAIPVNYVGGYFAFYRTGHQIVSASNIIMNDSDKIENKLPSELRVGDFVVVRESDHDLIREIADLVLERSGKAGVRELASKWKEAIKIMQVFFSDEKIYEKLSKIGCKKSYITVKSWLTDNDMIAPQSKEDLQHIAAVTQNGVLQEKLDQIYEAGRTVKAAHVVAGRELSLQLKKKVVLALKEREDIDPFNIWEPIEMPVDGIGLVKILKVIDVVEEPVLVDIADTNRLLTD
ncbi:MAG: DrmE family protein [Phascolarctobacterium sp.]|nr:DrmE family protein [Phascolarctobacterium sp.]